MNCDERNEVVFVPQCLCDLWCELAGVIVGYEDCCVDIPCLDRDFIIAFSSLLLDGRHWFAEEDGDERLYEGKKGNICPIDVGYVKNSFRQGLQDVASTRSENFDASKNNNMRLLNFNPTHPQPVWKSISSASRSYRSAIL